MTENPTSLGRQPIVIRTTGKCCWCRKPIWRSGGGATWLHRGSQSASCYPGCGSWKRANPVEVE